VFKILKESSISSGVRRIEAVTNIASLELINKEEEILAEVSTLLGTNVDNLYEKVRGLQSRVSELEKAVKRGKRKKIDEILDIDKQSVQAGEYTVVSLKIDDYSQDELREISDRIKARLKMAVIILASAKEKRTSYVLTATDDAVKAGIHSGHLLKRVLNGCDGSGGGRPHLAQGGGTNPDNIEKAFRKLKDILEEG
jgi:alanyl-tRNA synthetase